MNAEKRANIEKLSRELFAKQERVRMMGMSNTPTDPEEREQCFVDNHLAEAEAQEAAAALRDAMRV